MEKMNVALEKMKMLVGMEADEESSAAEDSSSSFAFMDDFNRNCTLSTKQRLYGFVICLISGVTCTLLSMLVFFNPIKFGITFSFGNLLALGSTAFLIGPKRQMTMMVDPVRIYATAIYLASIIVSLFCALYVRNKLLTFLAISLEFGALVWLETYKLRSSPGLPPQKWILVFGVVSVSHLTFHVHLMTDIFTLPLDGPYSN